MLAPRQVSYGVRPLTSHMWRAPAPLCLRRASQARLGASETGVLARWAGRALRGGCAGCAGACAGCGVWLQGCCLGSRRCTPPIRDLIGLPTLVARFPTAGALPEGPGRPVLGLRRVRGCASGAVWAGGTCLQAGCAPKPRQGLWLLWGWAASLRGSHTLSHVLYLTRTHTDRYAHCTCTKVD